MGDIVWTLPDGTNPVVEYLYRALLRTNRGIHAMDATRCLVRRAFSLVLPLSSPRFICHYCFAHVSEEPDLPRQLQLRLQQVIRSQGLACHAVTID
jgi:hypothetical protein